MTARTITFSDSLLEWLEERARATEMTVDALVQHELEQARLRQGKLEAAVEYTLREYGDILERLGQ